MLAIGRARTILIFSKDAVRLITAKGNMIARSKTRMRCSVSIRAVRWLLICAGLAFKHWGNLREVMKTLEEPANLIQNEQRNSCPTRYRPTATLRAVDRLIYLIMWFSRRTVSV